MANGELMTWSKSQRRWLKEYRNKMYSVSPKQLGTERTKEASLRAANDWWIKRQKEIDDDLGQAKKHPTHIVQHYEDAIENHRLYAQWNRKFGSLELATKSETTIDFLREALTHDTPPFPLSRTLENPLYLIERDLPLDDKESFMILWFERYRTLKKLAKEQTTPIENTIRSHIDDYLKLRKLKSKLGTYKSFEQWLSVFRNWVDPNASIESIDEQLWEQFYIHLGGMVKNGKYTPTTAKNYQSAARAFIKSRWEKRLIELPRTLNSRELVFKGQHKEPVTFTVEEIHNHLRAATPKQKLYLLLMLNCGMYPSDIGQLKQSEVIWEQGRVTRKRTKTRDRSENVPKVDYPLWAETLHLLRQFKTDDPELVLLNENGKPLWQERERENGKWWRDDNIKSEFFRLQSKQMKLPKGRRKSLKSFRKTGASMLEQSQFGRFAEHYLGEAPHTITSKHYAHQNGLEFDAAIKWLGQQLGIE
jgi:integrase